MNTNARRIRSLRAALFGAALTLTFTLPAQAQSMRQASAEIELEPWEEVLRSEMDDATEAMTGNGLESVNEPVVRMVADGEHHSFSVTFGPGEYWLTGVCDVDCTDVDLAVYEADGDVVGSDYLVDDFPVVNFSVNRSATYEVRLIMASCSVDPCGVALQTFAR